MKQGISKDDYEVVKQLGKGSYGQVYSCYKKSDSTQRQLAIKVIAKDRTNFKEGEILAYMRDCKLKHENVVTIEEIFEDQYNVYFIMDLCDTDLAKVLEEKVNKKMNPFTEQEALNIIRQVTLGYRECYLKQILHRDIKPANILVKGGVYKIADFGESKVINDPNKQNKQTKVGTPCYQSPQLQDKNQDQKANATNKIDIYSLGIIFYELLTLELPFKANNLALFEFIKQLENNPFDIKNKLPNLDPELATLINKMLMFHEKDRIGWPDFFNHPLINCPILIKKISNDVQTIKKPTNILYCSVDTYQTQQKTDQVVFFSKLKAKRNENMYIDFFKNIPDSINIDELKQYFLQNKDLINYYFPYKKHLQYSKDYLIVLVGILTLIDGKDVSELPQNELQLRSQLSQQSYDS